MGVEIERKFLVTSDAWRHPALRGRRIVQGYLCTDPGRSVRIRLSGDDDAFLTVKGERQGAARQEYEYPIPRDEARELLALCPLAPVEKIRYLHEHDGFTWEIDVFEGENRGLVIAEVELLPGAREVPLPPWVGTEVTDDHRYYNLSLARRPYRRWPEAAGDAP